MTSKQKLLDWFCREGSQGVPDCDKRCHSRGDKPCFNLRELDRMLNEYRVEIVAETVGDVPCEKWKYTDCRTRGEGYNEHVKEVEKALKKIRGKI